MTVDFVCSQILIHPISMGVSQMVRIDISFHVFIVLVKLLNAVIALDNSCIMLLVIICGMHI